MSDDHVTAEDDLVDYEDDQEVETNKVRGAVKRR